MWDALHNEMKILFCVISFFKILRLVKSEAWPAFKKKAADFVEVLASLFL
jgi:hypothetical protein